MSKLNISSYVSQGSLVTRQRNNRIIRCGRKQRPYGIWEDGHDRVTITVNDERIITPQPRGIVRRGVVDVKVAKLEEI